MGVSEYKVNINTRDSLEKGLLLVGSSRSGRVDFENAIQMMEIKKFANRLKNIIYLEEPVREIKDCLLYTSPVPMLWGFRKVE